MNVAGHSHTRQAERGRTTRAVTGRPQPGTAACLLAMTIAAAVAGQACRETPTEPPPAREAYVHYCASCHGADGRGDGPLANELKTPPTDLTSLSARRGGFDEAAVMKAIDGRSAVAAHGSREMPVWGVVFEDEAAARDARYSTYTSLLTTRALVDYLRTLQPDDPPGDD